MNRVIKENDHLGAMTGLCYNQNCVIMSSIIKGLKCNDSNDSNFFWCPNVSGFLLDKKRASS